VLGKKSLQSKLRDVCLEAERDAHEVLREELETFIDGLEINDKENWYLHSLREVLSSLLANSLFIGEAKIVSEFIKKINEEQVSRE